ncbi:hypothetical protein IscW_ISCW016864 [Ixodes scapularis]|uniref:Uncharacterized protein n=1 Tax=Ixodes scapularis TaxID=6945 RepID=B7P9V9_IXOSC|nr:hypothetical protein IscW_ISCW016864 [Ixodes scapularis]|eukprot:XP_002405727.1 hypothetical protein IscW_ISCW016864 [Ixodes scapularis]
MAYGESALAAIDRGNCLTPFAAETARQHPRSSTWTAAEAARASLANRVSPILLRHPALRQDDPITCRDGTKLDQSSVTGHVHTVRERNARVRDANGASSEFLRFLREGGILWATRA